MAGFYDLMLLIDPNAPGGAPHGGRLGGGVADQFDGGEIVNSQDWGQRRMAYEIDHRPEAEYRLYQFTGGNDVLERLNQRLRINDAVLRFRIIKAKPGQPLPPPPEQQSARRRDDREPQDTRVAARAAADAPDRRRRPCRRRRRVARSSGRSAACNALRSPSGLRGMVLSSPK